MSIVIKIIENMSHSEWFFILTCKTTFCITLHSIRYGAQNDETIVEGASYLNFALPCF